MTRAPLPAAELRRALIFLAICLAVYATQILRSIDAAAEPLSNPLRLEALAGVCKHGIADKGTWWNKDYPTDIDAENGCFQLGLSRITGEWRGYKLGWRAAYIDFGTVKASNVFAMRDDEQFIGVMDGANCHSASYHGCIGRGIMSQDTRGVSLGGLIERDYGNWTLGAEGGGYLYYSRFRVTVVPEGKSHFQPVSYDWGGSNFTPYLGLTARHGLLFAAFRGLFTIRASENCHGCTGITSGLSYQAMLGLQIPLQ